MGFALFGGWQLRFHEKKCKDFKNWSFFRNLLYEIYFGKTRDIVNGLRSVQALSDSKQQEDLRKVMMKDFAKKNVTKAE